MTITGQNVEIHQQDYKVLNITVDEVTTLSGVSLEYLVYRPTTQEVKIVKTLVSGIVITGSQTFDIELEPEDTTNLLGIYNHQCRIIDTDSHPYTIFTGNFSVIYTQTI
jgi:hypothetical protein